MRMIRWATLLAVVLLGAEAMPASGGARAARAADSNPIVIENLLPGTDSWRLGRRGFSTANDTLQQIKGYASATSINKGEAITFYVTVNPAQSYSIELYRMGWYQGLGGRLHQQIGPLDGVVQPACPLDAATGLIACDWSPGHTLVVPDTWTSGIYLALLTNAQSYQNYIVFAVRDDARIADLLYQQPATTYQAYNNYPSDGTTGKSLYNFNSFGANTLTGARRAVRVSFDRPYRGNGAGDYLGVEQYFIRWLERSGYDVAYSTNLDTHASGQRLLNYKGFLSVGHDEYWSKEMYDAALFARDHGVNLAFFGANDVYWQIRLAPGPGGAADRIIVCYKEVALDPVQDRRLTTVRWRDEPVSRPEQQLIGVQYTANLLEGATYTYTVSADDHWVYAGTGLKNGDGVAGIIGDEVDRSMPEYPLPEHRSYTLLAQSPVLNTASAPDTAHAVIYQARSGAWVFGAGAITWSWGLDRPGLADPRLQQMAANLLNTFSSSPRRQRVYMPAVQR